MAERDYSRYQQKVIKRYYDNRDQIDEQRLSELVTSLYLASGKKQAKLWESTEDLMRRLNVPESRIEHLMTKKDPALIAEVVQDLQQGRIPKKPQTKDATKDQSNTKKEPS